MYLYMICIYIDDYVLLANILWFGNMLILPKFRSRRELSDAIVKRDFRFTGVEIWLFPFPKAYWYGHSGLVGPPGLRQGS